MSYSTLNASHSTYRGFKYYQGSDVKRGKGGYARVTLPDGKTAWGTATKNPYADSGFSISFLGWGDSPVLEITDFSTEDQAALRLTVEN